MLFFTNLGNNKNNCYLSTHCVDASGPSLTLPSLPLPSGLPANPAVPGHVDAVHGGDHRGLRGLCGTCGPHLCVLLLLPPPQQQAQEQDSGHGSLPPQRCDPAGKGQGRAGGIMMPHFTRMPSTPVDKE